MKVIRVDNFCRETVDDYLIKEGLTAQEAETEADRLNAESNPDGLWFYRAVADDYILQVWEP